MPAIEAPTENAAIEARCRQLVEFTERLPEHERSVVMLYYFDGHSVKAIAEQLACPVGTITMRLSRARDRLRKWIEETQS